MARVQFMTGNYLAFKVFQQSYKHVPTILHSDIWVFAYLQRRSSTTARLSILNA